MNIKRSILVLVILIIAIIHITSFWIIVDDAFISFRYAKNLADGHGLVFNKGERVEGYTNLLWILFLTPFAYMNLDLAFVSRVSGLIFSMLTLLLITRFSMKELELKTELVLLSPLFLVFNPSYATWSTGGLETSMFTFLIFALFYISFLMKSNPRAMKYSYLFSILFMMGFLSRPEGLIFGSILLFWNGLDLFKNYNEKKGQFFSTVILSLSGIILWFTWRWFYYGSLLPNHYNVKVNTPVSMIGDGLVYSSGFLLSMGWYVVLFITIGVLLTGKTRIRGIVTSLIVTQLLFVSWVGGDFMGKFRFFMPILPFIALLLPISIAGWKRKMDDNWKIKSQIYIPLITVIILFRTFAPTTFGDPYQPYFSEDVRKQKILVDEWTSIAHMVSGSVPKGTVIAITPAGVVPYYSGMKFLDMYGLTEPNIAKAPGVVVPTRVDPGHTIFNPEYVVSKKPGIIMGNGRLLKEPGDLSFVVDYFERSFYPPRKLLGDYYPVYQEFNGRYLNVLCHKSLRKDLANVWKTPEKIWF